MTALRPERDGTPGAAYEDAHGETAYAYGDAPVFQDDAGQPYPPQGADPTSAGTAAHDSYDASGYGDAERFAAGAYGDAGAFSAAVEQLADPLNDPLPGDPVPGGPAPGDTYDPYRHGAPYGQEDGYPRGDLYGQVHPYAQPDDPYGQPGDPYQPPGGAHGQPGGAYDQPGGAYEQGHPHGQGHPFEQEAQVPYEQGRGGGESGHGYGQGGPEHPARQPGYGRAEGRAAAASPGSYSAPPDHPDALPDPSAPVPYTGAAPRTAEPPGPYAGAHGAAYERPAVAVPEDWFRPESPGEDSGTGSPGPYEAKPPYESTAQDRPDRPERQDRPKHSARPEHPEPAEHQDPGPAGSEPPRAPRRAPGGRAAARAARTAGGAGSRASGAAASAAADSAATAVSGAAEAGGSVPAPGAAGAAGAAAGSAAEAAGAAAAGAAAAGGRAARRRAAKRGSGGGRRRAGGGTGLVGRLQGAVTETRQEGQGGGRGARRAGGGGRRRAGRADGAAGSTADNATKRDATDGAETDGSSEPAPPLSRVEARRAARAAKPTTGVVLSSVVGEVFITFGVLMLLFVTYQLWWTNVRAEQQARGAAHSLEDDWAKGKGKPDTFAPGQGFAILHIPKLDVVVPIAQGTDKQRVLDRGMVGHYGGPGEIQTAMPEAKTGNFALAGHRNTHGEPFRYINRLAKGDEVIVETQNVYYVYKVTSSLPQTSASNIGVIGPVPPGSGLTGPGRYITLTTCTPEYTSKYRLIVWGRMVEERPRSEGKPKSLVE